MSEVENACLLGYREDAVGVFTPNCIDNLCYYKQLKRLEKENEELKEKLKITETAFEMVQNTIGQAHIEGVNLARKNHKLKIALEEIRNDLGNGFNNARSADDLNILIETTINKINKVLGSEE